ncbi:hypothetical protein MMC24_007778 [Lignoscripta atroalba]|nr:hypothetical protein [Lignoscripta atroalba]
MNTHRNIYKDDVDFSLLALQSPEFNKQSVTVWDPFEASQPECSHEIYSLKSNGQLDFSNPEAVQQLTKSLLKRDFGLEIELPDDRLCPPVFSPGRGQSQEDVANFSDRLNYILWIQDLLDTTSESYTDHYDPEREVIGLDVGTGSSCIYPLLGCSLRSKWRFAATEPDIDEKNMQHARRNIVANSLKSRIRPLQTTASDPLFPLDKLGLESIDFTICNPPFFSSTTELLTSAASKSRPPHSACTGAEIEMVTPGGEVAFISRMIEESISLQERVQWYTSMLGKFSSVGTIIEKLKERGVTNWAAKEFVQGERTRRWGVAWSWGDMRPTMDTARGISTLPKHLLPFPSEYTFSIPNATVDNVASLVNTTLQDLNLRWQYRPSISTGIGFAKENVWSRSARRNRQKKELVAHRQPSHHADAMAEDSEDDDESDSALGFKVQMRWQGNEGADGVEVMLRWVKGQDSVLFESFCGMLKRQSSREARTD